MGVNPRQTTYITYNAYKTYFNFNSDLKTFSVLERKWDVGVDVEYTFRNLMKWNLNSSDILSLRCRDLTKFYKRVCSSVTLEYLFNISAQSCLQLHITENWLVKLHVKNFTKLGVLLGCYRSCLEQKLYFVN